MGINLTTIAAPGISGKLYPPGHGTTSIGVRFSPLCRRGGTVFVATLKV
nr:hypothetical protein [Kibdelosporangium sp. MJ126-NF4]